MTTNALTIAGLGPVSNDFDELPLENDLGAGIESSYAVMKYKGKVWTLQFRGEERSLMRPDNTGPMNHIDVVIIKAAKVKSKIFYEGGYVEGAKEAPTCWSSNGVTPDASVAKKQSALCANCPKNEWGSRTTEAGKKGKLCTDSKRIAIVPAHDTIPNAAMLQNDMFGGPVLLRIPAATLAALQTYGDMLSKAGFRYQQVVTRISFDVKEAYPTFIFQPVRQLTKDEARVAVDFAKSPQVERIVAEGAAVDGAPAPALQFLNQTPTAAAVSSAAATAPAPAAAHNPTVAPAPSPAPAPAPAATAPAAAGGFGVVAPPTQPKSTGNGSAAAPLVGGFGGVPVAPPVTQQVTQQAAPATAPVEQVAQPGSPEFEAELDALIMK